MKNWMLIICPIGSDLPGFAVVLVRFFSGDCLDGWRNPARGGVVDYGTDFDSGNLADSAGCVSTCWRIAAGTGRRGVRESTDPVDAGWIHALGRHGTQRGSSPNCDLEW